MGGGWGGVGGGADRQTTHLPTLAKGGGGVYYKAQIVLVDVNKNDMQNVSILIIYIVI